MQAPVEPEPAAETPPEMAPELAMPAPLPEAPEPAPAPEPPAASSMSMLDAAMNALRNVAPVVAAASEPALAPAAPVLEAPASRLLDLTIRQPAPEMPRPSSLLLDLGAAATAEPGGLLGADWRNAKPVVPPAAERPAPVFSLLDALGSAPAMSFAPQAAPPPSASPLAASGLLASLMPIAPMPAEAEPAPAQVTAWTAAAFVAIEPAVPAPPPPLPVLPAAAVSLTLSQVFSRLAGRSDVEALSPGDDMPAPAPLP